jgi:hypothetical protein
VLYEQFADARLKAVELTDRYHQTSADDPERAVLRACVERQTELARSLLESWLRTNGAAPRPTANRATVLR